MTFKLLWTGVFYDRADEGMGIPHVIHPTLQPHTHHTTPLTHCFQRRRQLNLRDMITLDLLLHDILMQLRKNLGREDILSKHTVKFFHTFLVAHAQEFLGITGLGFLLHHIDKIRPALAG